MPYLTPQDVLSTRIDLIRKAFPRVRMEFSTDDPKGHLVLWVYVLDTARSEEVKKYCREHIESIQTVPDIPVRMIVQPFEGSWPEGKPDPDYYKRREAALARHAKKIKEWQAQGIGTIKAPHGH